MRKKYLNGVLVILGSIVLAVATYAYQPKEWTVVGNVCTRSVVDGGDWCFKKTPTAGFPLSYLHDNAGTSVIGKLGPEDNFNPAAFIFDAAFFAVVIQFILDRASKLRKV